METATKDVAKPNPGETEEEVIVRDLTTTQNRYMYAGFGMVAVFVYMIVSVMLAMDVMTMSQIEIYMAYYFIIAFSIAVLKRPIELTLLPREEGVVKADASNGTGTGTGMGMGMGTETGK